MLPLMSISMQIQPMDQHQKIQQDFKNIRRKLGMQTSDADIQSIRRLPRGSQRGATQAKFNEVRSKLNQLLAKEYLTDKDITDINAAIAKLTNLNPARWPHPKDYQEVLNKKLENQKKLEAQAQASITVQQKLMDLRDTLTQLEKTLTSQ